MVKTIRHPETGRTVKLGRRRPVSLGPHLKLRNYLLRHLPDPPPTCDYRQKAMESLLNVYLNDMLGDCVIAGMAHSTGVFTGNSGDVLVFTQQQIVNLYSAIGGYVPGDPATDNGCDEITALNYWQTHGAPIASPHRLAGWLALNPSEPFEYHVAMWLFENVILAMDLPDLWINPYPQRSGFLWTKAGPPDPANGHLVVGVGYAPEGVAIASWGMIGTITCPAIKHYCAPRFGGNLFTVVDKDTILRGAKKAPNGFAWAQLVADFDALGGQVPSLAELYGNGDGI